jgi:uncharacterized membrane protein YcaP (DUF421 family)
MQADMIFGSFSGIVRVMVVGVLAYIALVLALRVTGKRTLSKLNAFDLIVTVALGSTLATVLLSKDVPLSEGVTAFLLLILLQYVVTWASVRSRRVRDWVKAEPRLLFRDGEYLHQAMRVERVTHDELLAAMRGQGHDGPDSVGTVVLETDGSLSVTKRRD